MTDRSAEIYRKSMPMSGVDQALLPSAAFVLIESNPPGQRIGVTERGMSGYFRTTIDQPHWSISEVRREVRRLNEFDGLTPIQQECMFVGSLFGWDVPGANPATYKPEHMTMIEAAYLKP